MICNIKKEKYEKIFLVRDYYKIDKWDEQRVLGRLYIDDYVIDTLENRKYIVEPGVYKIEYEYSPKFNRDLWELKGIPKRSEIKIHNGKRTEHTRGCIIVRDVDFIHSLLDNKKNYIIHIKNQ